MKTALIYANLFTWRVSFWFGDDISLHLLLQAIPLINSLSTKAQYTSKKYPSKKTFGRERFIRPYGPGETHLFEI
jgi:hypothetical protein